MDKLYFLLGLHNHQPVGNFDHVFAECFNKSYLPFLEILEKHPRIRLSLHYSGPLLEWMEENRKWFFERLNHLISKKQIEILSGGFYEPLLSILPEKDALGQIEMMNDFIKEKFSCTPQGMWLAERVWDPTLPGTISNAGIKYTILDDTHFYYAGLKKEDMFGYYLTEKNGKVVSVFPIDRFLRYSIPFRLPEETINYFRSVLSQYGSTGITFADDGEKFGVWPGTHKWVYEEKWLENFFNRLEENSDWIEMLTYSEYMEKFPPRKKIFLPSASYEEMMEWSLPDAAAVDYKAILKELEEKGLREKYRPFIRGGLWDNFLVKYPEVNQMHKKMLYVSGKVGTDPAAIKELYKGQCNCPYWHGLFGGVYLNYLRHAIYTHLIAAENLVDKLNGKISGINYEIIDFDKDLHDEILVSNAKIIACFKPNYGGALMELDYRPKCFNLSNTFTRRWESYHEKIKAAETHPETPKEEGIKSIHDLVKVKEKGLTDKLFYDWYLRYSFLDHFLSKETNIESFRNCRYIEEGDFINQPYALESAVKNEKGLKIILNREGGIRRQDQYHGLKIKKAFLIDQKSARISAHYHIVNTGEEIKDLWFGVEFNFTLLAGDNPQRYYFVPGTELIKNRLNTVGESENILSFGMADEWNKIKLILTSEAPVTIWRFPVETVSQSEDGFEKNYQCSGILAHWKINLKEKGSKNFNLKLEIMETDG